MATVRTNDKFVTVTVGSEVIIYEFDSGNLRTIQCDVNFVISRNISNNTPNLVESVFIPCADISKCGEWFVFCYKKCLSLWKTSDWTLISNREINRFPSKIKFSPDGTMIIASDKGGDVYIYSRENPTQPGTLLLGHLSLVFDILVTPDQKFILSCDRDEKIRVSCFPNSYSIHSYCLGHEEFVTTINLLPHCMSVLISTSGDGSLRLWDYKEGRELCKVQCSHDIQIKDLEHVGEITASTDTVALLKCVTFQLNNDESLLCITFDSVKQCVPYIIKGPASNLSLDKCKTINLQKMPCDINLFDGILWIVSCEDQFELSAFQWNNIDKSFETIAENKCALNSLSIINKNIRNYNCSYKSKIFILYKKHYDNIEQYQKRKNERICTKAKKNKV